MDMVTVMAEAATGDLAAVARLMADGGDAAEHAALATAAAYGNVAALSALLSGGFNPNAGGEDAPPALAHALAGAWWLDGSDHAACVKLLLDAGANPNATWGGETPGSVGEVANANASPEVLGWLVAAGGVLPT